jgi:hypothetical protein
VLKHEQRRRQGGDYRIEPVHTAVDVAREYFTRCQLAFSRSMMLFCGNHANAVLGHTDKAAYRRCQFANSNVHFDLQTLVIKCLTTLKKEKRKKRLVGLVL